MVAQDFICHSQGGHQIREQRAARNIRPSSAALKALNAFPISPPASLFRQSIDSQISKFFPGSTVRGGQRQSKLDLIDRTKPRY